MSTGLLALLDDVAAIARMAAASVDDIAGAAAKAGAKSAGVVIDDAAVTPRYVVGFAAERELPIIARIARGSIRNKLVFLLPVALVLSLVAPWLITPLLMLGAAFLCYEGAEKVYEKLAPHAAHAHEEKIIPGAGDPRAVEDARVASAIKTDFILSAEIMAIALATIPAEGVATQALVLAIVAVGITAAVYGAVALIVKADDLGVALAARGGAVLGAIGRLLVKGMPVFLNGLAVVGTLAMLWVGGGILLHGSATLGWHAPEELIHGISVTLAGNIPAAEAVVEWLVFAAGSGLVGLAVGAALIPVASHVIVPVWRRAFA